MESCSTQKNTAISRSFHQMKTYYNIYYNGKICFDSGLETINKSNEDDFSDMLNLYPVSNHKAAEAATADMDKTIEKCRKCIKLHSIHVKPQINPKKRSDSQYQLWLQSKEFNNKMYLAWMMLGESEFHKGDFLGCIGTFNYVSKLYENDKDIVAQCQLWIARAYAEMGWTYESEDMLNKVQVDDLKRKNRLVYSAAAGDINIKAGHLKEAIPYVKVAKQNEKRKLYLPRFEYVLGQLYQRDGQKEAARAAYKRSFKLHPAPEMDFNARLHYAELSGDTLKTIKQLRNMTRLSKHKDRLDQIYGIMGNLYLMNKDTASALEQYQLAFKNSTQNGSEKAEYLIIAGDIYYGNRDYINASPCYKEAAQILTDEHPDHKRVQKRSEVLDEVVIEVKQVQLQDSLQYLSTLTEAEQELICQKIVDDLIASEQADSVQQAQAAREAANGAGGLRSVNTQNMLGGGGQSGSWYFYNPQLMRSGKQEFNRKWGNRVLEDDWRRLSKTATNGFLDDTFGDDSGDINAGNDSISSDSTRMNTQKAPKKPAETDTHKPGYYLQQIPRSEEDIKASNAKIADALYKLIFIYRDKVGDQNLSDETFNEFCRRFPDEPRLVDLYYSQYLNALRKENDSIASEYKEMILQLFPESSQAKIVSEPNYFESLRKMSLEQDSLYEATYKAYKLADYMTVKQNKKYAEDNYPLTPLMPRFLFLNAVSVAKTEGQETFKSELQDMVDRYPASELATMAKDMLAMMGQGYESQTGGSMTSLQDQRMEEDIVDNDTIPDDQTFSSERNEPSYVCVVIPQDEAQLNNLLYQVALFNFSQFLIKDFDLQAWPMFSARESVLQVIGFENMDEAEWYIGLMSSNDTLNQLFKQLNAKCMPITETNYKLFKAGLRPEE